MTPNFLVSPPTNKYAKLAVSFLLKWCPKILISKILRKTLVKRGQQFTPTELFHEFLTLCIQFQKYNWLYMTCTVMVHQKTHQKQKLKCLSEVLSYMVYFVCFTYITVFPKISPYEDFHPTS